MKEKFEFLAQLEGLDLVHLKSFRYILKMDIEPGNNYHRLGSPDVNETVEALIKYVNEIIAQKETNS